MPKVLFFSSNYKFISLSINHIKVVILKIDQNNLAMGTAYFAMSAKMQKGLELATHELTKINFPF